MTRVFFILALAAALLALLSACAAPKPEPEEPPVDGGTTDTTDPDAPKTVDSSEITSFRCKVSLLSFDLPESGRLRAERYELTAKREGGAVTCTRYRPETGEETFTGTPDFPERLQEIVSKHDLAAFNGISTFTSGLPDDFGATLEIEYASGESIRASSNDDMFLPLECVEDLCVLFYGPGFGGQYQQMAPEDVLALLEEDDFDGLIVDVRRHDEYASGHIPGALNVPNEDIQAGDVSLLPSLDQPLYVYCRTGRRSKEAAQKLVDLGYENVMEFGGVVDWPGELVMD